MKNEDMLIVAMFLVLVLIVVGAGKAFAIISGLEDNITELESQPPVTVTATVTKTAEVPVIEYLPQVEYVTETVYAEPSMFESVESLKVWLENWKYVNPIVYGESIFAVSDENDCDDKALQMVSDLARGGYIGGVAHDHDNYDIPHMLVCVPVGNDLYFVEPLTKEVFRELGGYWFVLD
jgi:hypothetical protein